MTLAKSAGLRLRQSVGDQAIQVPGAPNALFARMIERQGFAAAYLSGAAMSASVLALPDIGLFTLTELATQTRYLTRAVEIPIIVDADTGFGDTVNVERTVIELEAAGAAAIQLEDQQLPKRCGHLSGKSLVTSEVMCAKIRAAVASRTDPDLVILARTDARGVDGMAGALERAERYVEAGADWLFPEALQSPDEFARFAEQISVPLVANMTEFGKSPLLDQATLSQLGFAAVLYPVTLLRIAAKVAQHALQSLRQAGTQATHIDQMQSRQELYDLLNYDDYEQRDQQYFGRRNS